MKWIFSLIILLAMVSSGFTNTDTTYTYSPDNEYILQILWDAPNETDIAYYVVKSKNNFLPDSTEKVFPINLVEEYDETSWSVQGDFPIYVTEGDTVTYEFCLYAVDYSGNIGECSDPAYVKFYMPDTTPPAKTFNLRLKLIITPILGN